MYTLIYLSAASEEMSDAEIEGILDTARRNNLILNITGLLLYSAGRFIQVLEGPEESVTELYAKICKDPRHSEHLVLLEFESENRFFPEWLMGYRQHDENLVDEKSYLMFLHEKIFAPLNIENRLNANVEKLVRSFIETTTATPAI